MKTKQQSLQCRIPRASLFLTLTTILLFNCAQQGFAQQWSTNGNDINNTNSGNVGIGTTTPNALLEVNKNQNAGTIITVDNGFTGAGNAAYTGFFFRQAGANRFFFGAINDGNAIQFGGPGAVQLWNFANGPTLFATNNAERLRIDGNGNVGIGTATPSTRFEVVGASPWIARFKKTDNSNGGIIVDSTPGFNPNLALAVNGTNKWYILSNASNSDTLQFWETSGSFPRFTLTQSGLVGIGTQTPAFKLDVAGQVRSSSGGFVFPDGSIQTSAAVSGGSITAVNAGAGLTGGGTTGSLTLNVGAGTGVTVAADTVSVNYGSTAGTAVQGNTALTVSAGAGLSGGGSLTLGAGGSVTLTNSDRGSSQSIFKNVANGAGAIQFSAVSNSDTIRFQGSGGTTVSFDPATKRVLIDSTASGSSATTAANVSAGQFGFNTGGGKYTFPNDVDVIGNIAAKYQDVAEWVDSSQELPAGAVVVLDSSKSNQVVASTQSYDSRVAGVISLRPGLTLGERGEGRVLVATTGRVRVKVEATNAPIEIGDLLVTSNRAGFAMKSLPLKVGGVHMHRPGTLIGKALEPLARGTGEILVLLSLQ